jgi:copper homeostasis protein
MVRPRGGDFIYSTEEIESMKQTILFCQSIKVFGVVFGILHEDGTLNTEQMTILSRLAGPMEVTIHRAIDDTPDIFEAVQQLTKIPSINCVLSAGQAQTAMDGAHTLQKMVAIAGDNLTIIPGGKVTKQNLLELHNLVGSTTYHGTKIVGALN